MHPHKTLAVFGQDGAGKKTIVGNLLYKVCAYSNDTILSTANRGLINYQLGIDLKVLQQLETNTSRTYADIVTYFDQNNLVKSFYAPSGTIVVDGTLPELFFNPMVALILTASSFSRYHGHPGHRYVGRRCLQQRPRVLVKC